MSSNLYKHRNIVSNADNKRVINSNSMVAERLERLAQSVNKPPKEEAEGFQEGLSLYAQELSNPEELKLKIEKINIEAEQILLEARQQAEQIQKEALQQAEYQKQQAKEAGYEDGFRQGSERAAGELLQQEELLKERGQKQKEEYQRQLEELEPKLLEVILKVFEKVFHVQFDDKRDILLYLIQNAILNIEGSKEFQIRVCEENYLFLDSHKQEILERVGQSITIDVISDSLMKENQCTIETDSGVFECGLGVQLENLIKALRSLSL